MPDVSQSVGMKISHRIHCQVNAYWIWYIEHCPVYRALDCIFLFNPCIQYSHLKPIICTFCFECPKNNNININHDNCGDKIIKV